MDDTCVVVRPDRSDGVLDRSNGRLVEVEPPVVYDDSTLGHQDRPLGGMCKVKPSSDYSSERMVGERHQPTDNYTVGLPWDSPRIEIGDVVRVTSSRRDPHLVDREFLVKRIGQGTMLVQRRLTAEVLP